MIGETVHSRTVPQVADQNVLLEVSDLVMEYRVGGGSEAFGGSSSVRALAGVSLTLHRGETLGIVGESGCGKSTLARAIVRLIRPTGGRIVYKGVDITRLSERGLGFLRSSCQIVFQDPYASLDPRMRVREIVAEPLRAQGMDRKSRNRRVFELLEEVGLRSEHANRYPHEFSGGQRQRIGIARALSVEPELIVLDEPVSALDVSVQAQIINLLRRLQRDRELTLILISHDLSVVRHMSSRVAVMYLGRIVELGSRDNLFRSPLHPYTISLLSAVPFPDPRREDKRERIILPGSVPSLISPPSGCQFHSRCFKARQMGQGSETQTVEFEGAPIPLVCISEDPPLRAPSGSSRHQSACHFTGA